MRLRPYGKTGSLPMLFNLHVYSSWYRLQAVEMDCAFSESKYFFSDLTIDSVDNTVPYISKAATVLSAMVSDCLLRL